MSEDVLLQRIRKIRVLMREHGVNAFVVLHSEDSNPVEVQYLSGFTGSTCVIVISSDESVIITDPRYTTQAQSEVAAMDVVEMTISNDLYKKALPRALAQSAKVGLIEWSAPWGLARKIEANTDCLVVPLPDIIKIARSVKDSDEIEKIRKSVKATEIALEHAFTFVRPGVSEIEIAEEFKNALPKNAKPGFGPEQELIVASGKRSLMPHGIASDKLIEKGDVVQFDVGCELEGYISDISRVVVCGKATDEQKRMSNALVHTIDGAIQLYRSGNKAADAHYEADKILVSFGYEELSKHHALGHGIGLEMHEMPVVSPAPIYKDIVFEVGNVLSIEPGIYEEKYGFGMRIEHDVLITKDGPVVLDDNLSTDLLEIN